MRSPFVVGNGFSGNACESVTARSIRSASKDSTHFSECDDQFLLSAISICPLLATRVRMLLKSQYRTDFAFFRSARLSFRLTEFVSPTDPMNVSLLRKPI